MNQLIAIRENFTLEMFTKHIYHWVLLTIHENFPPQKVRIGQFVESLLLKK